MTMQIKETLQKPKEIKLPPIIKDYIGNKATLDDLEQLKHLVAKRYAELKVPRLDWAGFLFVTWNPQAKNAPSQTPYVSSTKISL